VRGQLPGEHDLAEVVQGLRDEVRVLRQALDELREEVQWANRNGVDLRRLERFRLRSMPADPAADDWAERLNGVAPEHIAAVEAPAGRTDTPAGPCGPQVQRSLF
jgi:hypothetical protein